MQFPKQPSTYISICVSFLWIISIWFWFWYFFHNNISLELVVFGLKWYIETNILLGILFFMCIYIVRPLFFIPASPFDVFAGMVFWPVIWFLVCSVTLFFSAMFSYNVWYYTWWIVLERKSIKKFEKLKLKLEQDTFTTTVMMRLVMLPFDLSNYICGVLSAPFWKYVFWTGLWVMPATVVFVSAGAAFYWQNINSFETLLENINYTYLILSSGFFISIILLSRILKKKFGDINL